MEFRAPGCLGPALPESPRPLAQQAAKPLASSAGSATGSWRFLWPATVSAFGLLSEPLPRHPSVA
jgi:hypothetical protein